MEREKRYYKYRYNPTCPNCKEEHVYYTVLISEEDQKIMDDYYAAHKGESSLALMLQKPPLVMESNFMCPICKTQFTKCYGLYRENQVGYQSSDCVPMGIVPVHEIKYFPDKDKA